MRAQRSERCQIVLNRRELIASIAGGALLATGMQQRATAAPVPGGTPAPAGIAQLGIFTPSRANGGPLVSVEQKIVEAHAVRANTIRDEQNLARPLSGAFAQFAEANLDLVLTIRDDPRPGAKGKPTVLPPHTPADLATFRSNLRGVLDQVTPVLVAVENEEASSAFVSGAVSDYLAELNAAIEVCHDAGIPVTNGGITAGVSVALTWQDLALNASAEEADDFARRVLAGPVRSGLRNALSAASNGQLPPGDYADAVARGLDFVKAYAGMPLDYVNFHWYIDDDQALRQTVAYLRQATGHEVVTHEIGQYAVDPDVVTGHLQTLEELGVPVVIWFDADGDPAVGLHDAPGELRANGEAFADLAPGLRL